MGNAWPVIEEIQYPQNIDHVLASRQVADGIDLFYLDGMPFGEHIGIQSFTALLDALDTGM